MQGIMTGTGYTELPTRRCRAVHLGRKSVYISDPHHRRLFTGPHKMQRPLSITCRIAWGLSWPLKATYAKGTAAASPTPKPLDMSVVQELVDAQSKIDMNVWAEMVCYVIPVTHQVILVSHCVAVSCWVAPWEHRHVRAHETMADPKQPFKGCSPL